jgi:hypothetical protein
MAAAMPTVLLIGYERPLSGVILAATELRKQECDDHSHLSDQN